MTHTPGPWRVRRRDGASHGDSDNLGWDWDWDYPNQPQQPMRGLFAKEADARLIAAAPDLLTALEGLFKRAKPDNWDEYPDQAESWRAAFRAVCRAKGLLVPKNMEAAS